MSAPTRHRTARTAAAGARDLPGSTDLPTDLHGDVGLDAAAKRSAGVVLAEAAFSHPDNTRAGALRDVLDVTGLREPPAT